MLTRSLLHRSSRLGAFVAPTLSLLTIPRNAVAQLIVPAMMRCCRAAALVGAVVLCTPKFARATEISSTFDLGAEGWQSVKLAYPNPGDPPVILETYSPGWSAAGGNPGGYIALDDPDGGNPTGNVQYWLAPSSFLGNRQLWVGGALSFDLLDSGSGYGLFRQEDVILTGGGLTLVYGLESAPSQAEWSHFSVGLSASGWRAGSYSGSEATQSEMTTVLSSLDAIYIRGEHQLGPDSARLDSVVMQTGPVPEPASMLAVGLGALATMRRKRR